MQSVCSSSFDFAANLKAITIITKDCRYFLAHFKTVPVLSILLNVLKEFNIDYDKISIPMPRKISLIDFYSKEIPTIKLSMDLHLPIPSVFFPLKDNDNFSMQMITDSLKIPKVFYECTDGCYILTEMISDPLLYQKQFSDLLQCFGKLKAIEYDDTEANFSSLVKLFDPKWKNPPEESFFVLCETAFNASLERHRILKEEPLLSIISVCEPKNEYKNIILAIRATIGFKPTDADISIKQCSFKISTDETAEGALVVFTEKMNKMCPTPFLKEKYCFLIPGTDEIIAGSYPLSHFIFIQKFIDSSIGMLDLTVIELEGVRKNMKKRDKNGRVINLPVINNSLTDKKRIFIPHFQIASKFTVIIEGIKFPKVKGNFRIKTYIYIGSRLIESSKSKEIASIDGYTPFGLKLKFNLRIADLSRYSKFVIKMNSVERKKTSTKGFASLPLFDRHGRLVTGRQKINFCLCRELPPTPTPTPISDYTAYVRFPEYSEPVIFQLLNSVQKPQLPPNKFTEKEIAYLNFPYSPLGKLKSEHVDFLVENRWNITEIPQLLPLYLRAINFSKIDIISELPILLEEWSEPPTGQILLLLGGKFVDPIVRKYIVSKLEKWSDAELSLFLLQLVQSIQFEPEDDSELSLFLIKRAIIEPKYLGLQFFWSLKSLFDLPWMKSRVMWTIVALIIYSDKDGHFLFSYSFTEMQLKLCQQYGSESLSKVQELLKQQKLPPNTQLPIDPKLIVTSYKPKHCFFADSAKRPLFLTFRSADPFCRELIRMMVKLNDDLRQDQITLQIMKVMDDLWKSHGLNMRLRLYSVLSTGTNQGIIEIVPNAVTIASIQKQSGKLRGAFKVNVLKKWLENKCTIHQKDQMENFIYSMAGYVVATYVLGIGDRHCSNMMIQEDGHFFHIDFGHFLGHFKTVLGIERESNLFYFSDAFVHVLDGPESEYYHQFEKLCTKALNILRANHHLIVTLLYLMLNTGIPELSSPDDLKYIENALMLHLSDEEASLKFCEMLKTVPKMKRTAVSDFCHLTQH